MASDEVVGKLKGEVVGVVLGWKILGNLKVGAVDIVLDASGLSCSAGLGAALKMDADCEVFNPKENGELLLFVPGVFEDAREDRPANGLDGADAVGAPAEGPVANKEDSGLAPSEGWKTLGIWEKPADCVGSALVEVCDDSSKTPRKLSADVGKSCTNPSCAKSPLGCGVSLSSSLTKSASLSAVLPVVGAGKARGRSCRTELSTIPNCDACLIFKPRMIATNVRPARFDSTYVSENVWSDVLRNSVIQWVSRGNAVNEGRISRNVLPLSGLAKAVSTDKKDQAVSSSRVTHTD